jgi:hypothetical protein
LNGPIIVIRVSSGYIQRFFLLSYYNHAGDWNTGDPTWQGGKGTEIIGALNYLSSVGVNSIYALTFNDAYGDGKNVSPWIEPLVNSSSQVDRFDVSKLDQWEIVLKHADKVGIHWVCVLSERENESAWEWIDGSGFFSDLRKIYYRELVARFSHHLGIVWGICEETQWDGSGVDAAITIDQVKAFAEYIHMQDPYDHPVTTHTTSGTEVGYYAEFSGFPYFECTSIQSSVEYNSRTISIREASAAGGRPLAVFHDEQAPQDLEGGRIRTDYLWPQLTAGGAGCEWYVGSDGGMNNFRNWETYWLESWYARDFFEKYVPFADAMPRNDLTSSGYCLAKPEDTYVIYLPGGGTTNLDLSDNNLGYTVQWYNPQTGGALQNGTITTITGGGIRSLGSSPGGGNDWAILVKVASVTSNFSASANQICTGSTVQYTNNSVGNITSYTWNFGTGASPATATGAGPHNVSYSSSGQKSVTLTVNGPDGTDVRTQQLVEAFDNCGELETIQVSPSEVNVVETNSEQFTAKGYDVIGTEVSLSTVNWDVSGGGSIDATGLFTAENLGGPYTVTTTSASVSGNATVYVVEPVDTILYDNFNRANSTTIGNPIVGSSWQKTETTGNTAEILNNRVYFTSADGPNVPLVKNLFDTEVTTGKLTWTFNFDWSRTGTEGTYEVRMQLGQRGLQDNDAATGVSVDLIWGGPNNGLNDHAYFGYVDNTGTVNR